MAFVRNLLFSVCLYVHLYVSLFHTHSARVENEKLVENIRRLLSNYMSLGSDLTAYQRVRQ